MVRVQCKALEDTATEAGDRTQRVGRRWWSPIINAEHLAMRDRVAMIDLSAFAIFDVAGPGVQD